MTKWMVAAAWAGITAVAACSSPAEDARPATAAPSRVASGSAAACDGSFQITNASPRVVMRLFFKDSALSGWGSDKLGQNMLNPRESLTFRTDSPGAYDFRVLWQDGRSVEYRRANICTATPITISNTGLNVR
ncbi:MAG: hypothetical protein JWR10_2817 [Rubritepida sp.]|nr:hypothetical protein [Rubritepida sp.]